MITDILADPSASFFRNTRANARQVLRDYDDVGIPTAIKTGTTNFAENGWMMGYSPKYATGVWVGNHENTPTTNSFMETLTGPIWGEYMRRAHEGQPAPERWARPEGIKTVAHNGDFFKVVKAACKGSVCNYGQSDIYPSWYSPKKSSNSQQKVVIDTVSNKRATECTPERARKEITGGGIIVPELDSSDPQYAVFMRPINTYLRSSAGEAIPAENEVDDVHSCSDQRPSVTISVPATCSGTCTISATVVAGTKTLRNLYFKKNGTTMAGGARDISSGGTYTFDLTPESSGAHEFSVEVVDEALYDATASASSNLLAIPFNLDSATSAGAVIKLKWDKLDAGASYWLVSSGNGSGSPLTCDQVGSKCTADVLKSAIGPGATYTLSVESTSPVRQTNSLTVTYP
jgi:hypothetical protein